MRNPQVRDLDYFAVVAKHGNLRRAAESLDLSQPALSKALGRLEKAVGAKLARRTSKGVALTAAGSAVLLQAQRLRLVHEDVVRAASEIGSGHAGHVRIGTGAAMAQVLLPAACSALVRETPSVTLHVSVSSNDILVPALRNGELDLILSGIPASPHAGLIHQHLHDDEFVVYASANHRLAHRRRVTLDELAAEQWATSGSDTLSWQWLLKVFADGGRPPLRLAVDTSALVVKYPLVGASQLLGFASRAGVREAARRCSLVELPAKEVRWRRRVGVSRRQDGYLSPAGFRLIDILKTTAQRLGRDLN